MSVGGKSKMTTDNDDKCSKMDVASASSNPSVKISVGEGTWETDIRKPSEVSKFPSGTEKQISPEGRRRSEVIPSDSKYNTKIKSGHKTKQPRSAPLQKEGSGGVAETFGKQSSSNPCSETATMETRLEQSYQDKSINSRLEECEYFQDGRTLPCSLQQNTEKSNLSAAIEVKLSDLKEEARGECQMHHANASSTKPTTISDPLAVEIGTTSTETHCDEFTSKRNFLPRDQLTSGLKHSTPVTHTNLSTACSNESMSVSAILPVEPSVISSSKSPRVTDNLSRESSNACTNPSDNVCTRGGPSSNTCIPSSIPKNTDECPIIIDISLKLLFLRDCPQASTPESVPHVAKSLNKTVYDGTSLPVERDFPDIIAKIPTKKVLTSNQPLEETTASKSSSLLDKNLQDKCYLTSTSASIAEDLRDEDSSVAQSVLKHQQKEGCKDPLLAGSGRPAKNAGRDPLSIRGEPLMSSTKVKNTFTEDSESKISTETSLCGTHSNDKFTDTITSTSSSKLNNSSKKCDFSKISYSCNMNMEDFEDQGKNRDGKLGGSIDSGDVLYKREQVVSQDINGISDCEFNIGINEITPSTDMDSSSSEICTSGSKKCEIGGGSSVPSIEDIERFPMEITDDMNQRIINLRKALGMPVDESSCENYEKFPTHRENPREITDDLNQRIIKLRKALGMPVDESSCENYEKSTDRDNPPETSCGNLNTSTDRHVGETSGSEKQEESLDKSDTSVKYTKLR
jgi:hypothetical protein